MTIGKHEIKIPAFKKKRAFLIVLSIVLLLCLSAGASFAWITVKTAAVDNTFTPGSVTCEVDETITGSNKTSVKIENTGNTDAYIRVAVVANTIDEAGSITGAADVSSALAAAGWKKVGDYYYYTSPVAPEGCTGELLKSSVDLTGRQVIIISEAIQSEPAAAISEAWGITLPFGE